MESNDSLRPLRKKPRAQNGDAAHELLDQDQLGFPAVDSVDRPPAIEDNTQEKESLSTGLGSKKACLKFFSTHGCPFGENCHFSHYIPGGFSSRGHLQPSFPLGLAASNKDGAFAMGKSFGRVQAHPLGRDQPNFLGGYKTRLCKNFGTPEGCRFGKSCHFAHGESELRKDDGSSDKDVDENKPGVNAPREPLPPGLSAAASFGALSKAKISIDASLVGIIIGKGGVNAKTITRMTGARIYAREHESDPNLRNIEMEGSFDQIKHASMMIREMLVQIDVTPARPKVARGPGSLNWKTKLCENFPKGTCTFGEQCNFAHGPSELRSASSA